MLAAVRVVGHLLLQRCLSLASLVSLDALKELKICTHKQTSRAMGAKQTQASAGTRLQHALCEGRAVERVRLVAQQVPLERG
jgi:hypothetical protein